MAKPIAAFKGGVHALVEIAVRADGKVFRRFQNKTFRGYQWSAWSACQVINPNEIPCSMSAGFSECYRANEYSNWQNWRLPNN